MRRWLGSLIMVGYVAGQIAAWPHAHPSQIAGHDSRPHAHGAWLADAWAAFTCAEQAHDHHQTHGHSHSSVPEQVPVSPADQTGSEHDEDCAYLPYALVAAKDVRMADEASRFVQSVADYQAIVESMAPEIVCLPTPTALPECGAEHCALYLRLRTLRI